MGLFWECLTWSSNRACSAFELLLACGTKKNVKKMLKKKNVKNELYVPNKDPERDLQKRPAKETFERTLQKRHIKEIYGKALQKRPIKETRKRTEDKHTERTYNRDLQKISTKKPRKLTKKTGQENWPPASEWHTKKTCLLLDVPTCQKRLMHAK